MTLDAESCAAMLCCSKTHLHRLARSGEIPACKVGRGWVFVEADVVEWMRAKHVPKPSVVKSPGRPRKRIV